MRPRIAVIVLRGAVIGFVVRSALEQRCEQAIMFGLMPIGPAFDFDRFRSACQQFRCPVTLNVDGTSIAVNVLGETVPAVRGCGDSS